MLTHACKLFTSFSLLLVGACDLKPEFVGATLPDASTTGDITTADATTTDAPTGDTTDSFPLVTTSGAPTGAPNGAPCELGPADIYEEGMMPDPDAPIAYISGPLITPSSACAGEVCLFAATHNSPLCDDDAACAGQEHLTGKCSGPWCEVKPAWGEAHTTCTSVCEVDTDCPAVPGCAEAPICAPLLKLGSLCCEKLCACPDELSEQHLQDTQFECNSGMYCQ